MARQKAKTVNKNYASDQLKKILAELDKAKIEYKKKSNAINIAQDAALDGHVYSIYFDGIGNKFVLLDTTTKVEITENKYPGAVVKVLKPLLGLKVENKKAKKATKTAAKKGSKPKKEKVEKEPRRTKAQLRQEKNVVIEDIPFTQNSIVKKACEPVKLITLKDSENVLVPGFMGVKNEKKNEVVSVVSDTYNLLPNKVVLDPVLDYFEQNNIKYKMDRFTYVTDERMRIHFTFPDIKIKDDTKRGILSSIFMHNSYNMLEAFRFVAGAMRQVCSNGMIIGDVVSRVKVVHKASNINEISVAHVKALLDGFHDNMPKIEARIKEMIDQKTSMELLMRLSRALDNKVFSHLMRTLGLADEETSNRDIVREAKDLAGQPDLDTTMWETYNILTDYISHYIQQRYRVDYLRRLSKVVKL